MIFDDMICMHQCIYVINQTEMCFIWTEILHKSYSFVSGGEWYKD